MNSPTRTECLNPYSIGIWSATLEAHKNIITHCCLNPYSIGIWSATTISTALTFMLISLNPYSIGIWSATSTSEITKDFKNGLNPYSIGIWSATQRSSERGFCKICVLILILLEYGLRQPARRALARRGGVLILILLEYGLRPIGKWHLGLGSRSLNPYSIGIWSATFNGRCLIV